MAKRGEKKMAAAATVEFPKLKNYDAGEDLARKTLVLRVRTGMLGNSRKVSSSQIEVDADKKLIKVSKTLLDSKELNAIRKLDSDLRAYLFEKCLTFGESSFVMVPYALVTEVEAKLEAYEQEREALIDVFIAAYSDLCKKAEERLRGVYNAADYPSKKVVRSRFYFSYKFVNFGVPGALKDINAALFKKEQEKFAQSMKEAVDEVRGVMRETLMQMVGHLSERLTDQEGETKVFHKSAIDKLTNFLNAFDIKNVTDDRELQDW